MAKVFFLFFICFSFYGVCKTCVSQEKIQPTQEDPLDSAQACLENKNIPIHDSITLNDDGICFDRPEAQIINVSGQIEKDNQASIIEYYKEMLPGVGWLYKKESPLTFERENQVLTITFKEESPTTHISFSLKSKDE